MSKRSGETSWLVLAYLASVLYYVFVYPFVWIYRRISGTPMD